MKKILAFIIIAVAIVLTVIIYKYKTLENSAKQIQQLNTEFENFSSGEIMGTSIITLINKSTDLNNKNNVSKDKEGYYIDNNKNSIQIEIKFLGSDKTFRMEDISNHGSEEFVKNYASAYFKCTERKYHESTKRIKYMSFEEI